MKAKWFFLILLVAVSPIFAMRFVVPPDVPETTPNPAFPVHIHLFHVHWNHVNGSYEGYGRADILGPSPQGVDYTFSCGTPFLHNVEPTEFYQARWKKQDRKLELLMQRVGSDHVDKCQLNTTVKPTPYGSYGPAPAPGQQQPRPK